MKTAVSSYSFNHLLRTGEETQLSLIALASDLGFGAIEFTDLQPPKGQSAAEYAQLLREESEKQKLPIVNYTIGAELLGCADFEAEIARLCAQADIAARLGAKGMRHDATGGFPGKEKAWKSFDQALPQLIEGCRRVTQYAQAKGVATMVENHGYFCQESARLEKLVTGVAEENFGLLIDIGNFACADEPSHEAVGRLSPFAKYVHLKDFHIKRGSGADPGFGFFRSRGGNFLRGAILV